MATETQYPEWVEEIRKRFGGKGLLSFVEVMEVLGRGKDYVYERLASGELEAHNPGGAPGRNGTKIVASSLWRFLAGGVISKEKWSE